MDVAALAGVSIKTVSRVLNGERHVGSYTRQRVQRAIEMLDYRPNIAARSLSGARAYLIGLFFDNPSPGYVSEMQAGAMRACRRAAYHLVVEQLSGAADESLAQLDQLARTLRMDGVVLSPPVCDRADVLALLDARGVPYARIAPAAGAASGHFVWMDDAAAARAMTSRLIELGHRRIAFIRGHAGHAVSEVRYGGFREALAKAGLPLDRELVKPGDFSFRSGWEAGLALLDSPRRPSAVFASNDDMALGVMAAAHRLKLSVPEDLSVAGFDDSPGARVVWPQLTTVRQPVALMTEGAIDLLVARPAGATGGRLYPFEIVERGSTAAAAAAP